MLVAIAMVAHAADEDGIRVGQVQFAYFVETFQANMTLDQALAAAKSGGTTALPLRAPTTRAEFDTWVAPLSRQYQESILTGFADTKHQDGKTVIDRFVRDNFRHVYVSYEVTVELLPGDTYRATFAQSTAPVPESIASGWQVTSTLNFPVPQILQDGDTVTLDLYSDNKTGQRVVEDIHFGKQASMVLRKGAARDVYADDDLTIAQPRVRKNGVALELSEVSGSLAGPVLWIYVPGEGRYVLSLKQRAGFKRVGEVVGNSVRFNVGGNVFRIDCGERIADAGSGTYNLYAMQDSEWEPADAKDRAGLMMGSLSSTAEKN